MKTIKFRGKTIDGTWIYGSLAKLDIGYCIITNDTITIDIILNCNKCLGFLRDKLEVVIPETIGQFTGLFDKNGTEIYEGDIIRFIRNTAKLTYVVTWMKGGFWLTDRGYGGKLQPQLQDIEDFAASCGYKTQIISNIHDNTELLKNE